MGGLFVYKKASNSVKRQREKNQLEILSYKSRNKQINKDE